MLIMIVFTFDLSLSLTNWFSKAVEKMYFAT